MLIHVSIFYKRGEFYWIGGGSDEDNDEEAMWFGNFPRAMQSFTTNIYKDRELNLKRFLYDYEHSKFIECNKTSAERNLNIYGQNYRQTSEHLSRIMPGLQFLSQSLEKFYKNYTLISGTLLGWYRDCGVIPHTTDVDLGMFIDDYEDSLKKFFLGNRVLHLAKLHGMPNNSYEFRLFNEKFVF